MTKLKVMREIVTIEKLSRGHSIARFGDGELRLALGKSVGHQEASHKLTEELNYILRERTACLVGIPYIDRMSPKRDVWINYGTDKFTSLYNPEKVYYSAFITRPDSAPWIDNEQYWESVKDLYRNKHVTVVCGSKKGFREEELEHETKSIHFIETLPEQAYAEIDNIEKEIGNDTTRTVLLAVGATATVLAARLAERGFNALDLGHLPMFMRRRGCYA